jgi:TetR/AcrR family transcriptional regulator, transcriptional repressor for nem operon
MPYPDGHRNQTRGRIVDSARRLFNRHGFDNVSLDSIMAGAGLTRGGFYNYFESKSDLYAEVLGCFFTDPEWKNCWEGVEVDLQSGDVASQVIRAYLSQQHYEDVENSCPMVALPTDVSRSGHKAKRAFETVFAGMVSVLERSAGERRQKPHATAQAVAALCVGGMVVARAMENRASADALLGACMQVALELGGWERRAEATKGRALKVRRRQKRSAAAR